MITKEHKEYFLKELIKLKEEEFCIIKEFIDFKELCYKRFLNYSENAVDPQIKQYFEKIAINALNEKEKIINYL